MTPAQKIKRDILLQFLGNKYNYKGAEEEERDYETLITSLKAGITEDTVDDQYDAFVSLDCHYDYESEFREGQVETKLSAEYSRHYESKAVARKLSDGSWVGWTYWYGGGKHGDPESIEWMDDAYNLEVTETEKLIVVQEFKKIE